jgi:ribosomal protein S18 acetylase RimI-like enzyme
VSRPRIWLADFDEAETIAALLVEFRDWYGRDWPSDNAFLASVERLIDDRRATEFLLGAPHDDAPPGGICQLRYRFSVWTASEDCWLEDLYVREEARGAGLGRAMVQEACRRAAERGCERIELDVSEANTSALALYEALGFATGKLPGSRDLFMQKKLTPAR